MPRRSSLLAVLFGIALAFLAFLAWERPAWADATPIAVVGLDSDDADEHAEAFTGALRSRLRNTAGWKLSEAEQTLSLLTAALRCSKPPDTACEQKIAEQLKVDRFVWGSAKKGVGKKITVELHAYRKGIPGVVASESYADNLKDQNDDALRQIAYALFQKVIGSNNAWINLKAGNAGGYVTIDGGAKVPFEKGLLRTAVEPGSRKLEVVIKGAKPQTFDLQLAAQEEKELVVRVAPGTGTDANTADAVPWKRYGGYAAIGVGVVTGIVTVVKVSDYASASGKQEELLQSVPDGRDVCALSTIADTQKGGANAEAACRNNEDAKSASTGAWIFGGITVAALAAGAYLVLTSSDGAKSSDAPAKPKTAKRSWGATPVFAPSGGGLSVSGEF
jgi:hypothetical protein